jgi:serine/threonine protein kinase/tetratricopeptide (TPR) repeat protein
MPIAAGTVFGPYKVIEKIGSGGMGDVYRALDTRLEREVAVKLVSDSFIASELSSAGPSSPTPFGGTPHSRSHLSHERFLREARAAATLNHPNICAIHDVGEQDGRPYLVMELLQGETLKAYLSHHILSAPEVLTFAQQAASALASAHGRGIVHRDIKPANLFVVNSGIGGGRERRQLKVLDFGLAKKQGLEASPDSRYFESPGSGATQATDLTIPGSTVGTAAYMSPEQARGESLDARTDLFSLGSVLYEMATGLPPFAGRSTAEVFAALLMRTPPPVSSVNPAMPHALDAIIATLLAKERDERYASAEDLLADLEEVPGAHVSGVSRTPAAIPATPPVTPAAEPLPPAGRTAISPKPRSRKPLLIAGSLLVIVIVIAGFATIPLLRGHLPGKRAAVTTTPSVATPVSRKDSIIVADFINKTGDPVFNATLDQALRVQLGQSPVLDIISQQHLRQSLQYLGRKQDESVTPQIAREIGEREGVKAILTGTIAPFGKAYLLTLTAQNTASGDDIASEEATAQDKDHVLDALNQAATGMRAKLGESLSSIQKLNAPFGQATTPSLEAFRAYALGDEAHQRGDDLPEAENHYKRALELDPKLAMAWARLGVLYLNSGQTSKAADYFTHAYQLSGNVSEREKLYIAGHYHSSVIGDTNKSIETLEVATQEYPLQLDNFVNLGVFYTLDGNLQKSEGAIRTALALQPDDAAALENGIAGAAVLGQDEEARKLIAQANRLGLNGTTLLLIEAQYYATRSDWPQLQKILAQTTGRPDQFVLTIGYASVLAQLGQFHQAHDTYIRSAEQAASVKASDSQAAALLAAANNAWPVGQCIDPKNAVKQALKMDKGKDTQGFAAGTLTLCDEKKEADKMLSDLQKHYPQDTLIQEVYVPQFRAWLAYREGDPQRALALLERVREHDPVSFAPYMRGVAYLQLKDAHNAIASFQDATRLKGIAYFSNTPYALSLLGLGRAYALAGDNANAKKAYDGFFTEWKNADPGLPIVTEAKQEYARL